MKHLPLITLDFDGVLHSYSSGWKGATNIPDPPVQFAIEWLMDFLSNYCQIPDSLCAMAPPPKAKLAIFSSRSRYWGGRKAMKKWLVKWGVHPAWIESISFPLWKPSSTVLLDDRAVTFTGTFPDPESLLSFKPWNKK